MRWETKQKIKQWATLPFYLLLGIITSRILVILLGEPNTDNPGLIDWLLLRARDIQSLVDAIPVLGNVLQKTGVGNIELMGAAVFGFPLWVITSSKVSHHLFASFNNDVLLPIIDESRTTDANKRAGFIRLNWFKAQEGPRSEAWAGLNRWLNDSIDAGDSYKIALLVGRAGSGKSRLAGELARQRARRDVLGSSVKVLTLKARFKHITKVVILNISSWIRHAVPFVRPHYEDPWDVGVISPNIKGENLEQYRQKLKDWRPRRPTFVILDDPIRGETEDIHKVLSSQSQSYKHPVRLLIVNQTVPQDSPLRFSYEEWRIDGSAANPIPFSLPVESWFGETDTIKVSFETLKANKLDFESQAQIRKNTYNLTNGNPLLIEIALEYLLEHKTLEGLSEADIKNERARRIINALEQAGMNKTGQFAKLVVSTLCGGVNDRRITDKFKQSLLFADNIDSLPEPSVLQHCFPSDTLSFEDGAAILPPVRPELIMTAFIDVVSDMCKWSEKNLTELVVIALKISPLGVFRLIPRLPATAKIVEAFNTIEWDALEKDIDQGLLAETYCDIAIWLDLGQGHDWTPSLQEARMKRAKLAIHRLAPAQLDDLLDRLKGWSEESPSQNRIGFRRIEWSLLHLIHETAAQRKTPLAAQWWIDLYAQFENILPEQADIGDLSAVISSAANCREGLELSDKFFNRIWNLGYDLRDTFMPVMNELRPEGATQKKQIRMAKIAAAMAAVAGDGETAKKHADQTAKMAKLFLDDPKIQKEVAAARQYEASAWSEQPKGAAAKAAQAAADLVAEIGKSFPTNREIQEEVARSRCNEAYAWSLKFIGTGAVEAQVAADRVAKVGECFPSDQMIQKQVAKARCHLANAFARKPYGVEAKTAQVAADEVADIGVRFPDNREIQVEVAKARRYVAFAWKNQKNGAGAKEVQITADQVAMISRRFTSDREIQKEMATARTYQAVAYEKLKPSGTGAAMARVAVDKVAAIYEQFPEDREIREQLVKACQHEANAWCLQANGVGAAEAKIALDRVASIIGQFPSDLVVQMKAAIQRVSEANAWSKQPNGVGAEEAQAAADRVAKIGSYFPSDSSIQHQVALARSCETYAWSQQPKGASAADTSAAADQVAEIGARFPDNEDIQYIVAEARRHEVYAWCQKPNCIGAKNAKATADSVAEIAMLFPQNRGIQMQEVISRRCEAYAWCQEPNGAGAEAAQAVADVVAEIGARFLDDLEIQKEVANAREYEAYAWSRQPHSAGIEKLRMAIDQIAEVGARFPLDPDIQERLKRARSLLRGTKG